MPAPSAPSGDTASRNVTTARTVSGNTKSSSIASAWAAVNTRPVVILAALFVLSLPLVTTRIYASDEVQYFSYLRSLWFDRDVSFENEYRHFYDSSVVHYPGFHETFLERTTETGLRHTFATMGSAILWTPFYASADLIVRVRRALGDSVTADGYSHPYVAAVAYGSAVYGWLALVVSLSIVRRVFDVARPDGSGDAPIGLLAALAVWIGTPLFFYMYVAPPMSHACSAFAVALFVLAWLHVRERWSPGGMALLGTLAALMTMVREQDAFVAIGPAVDWGWGFVRTWRLRAGGSGLGQHLRMLRAALVGAAAFVVAYTPQLAAYIALNGYPGPSRIVSRKMSWMAPHALGVLASPHHGLLFWTPLVVLSLLGLGLLASRRSEPRGPNALTLDAARQAPAPSTSAGIAICALLIVAAQVYVAGSVESWTVAGAFGQRRFVGLTAIGVLGLAVLFSASAPARWPRRLVVAAVALSIWWNLGLMAQFGAGLMDRQRLELQRNAYHTFITIPRRLPEIVYRYVFERQSFFKPRKEVAKLHLEPWSNTGTEGLRFTSAVCLAPHCGADISRGRAEAYFIRDDVSLGRGLA
jgi:hypothetical protein